MDRFPFFFSDLKARVAGLVADSGAAFSNTYAMPAEAVFTMYKFPILVLGIEVPPWCEIVVADFRGFIAGFYENCLARLLKGMEVTVGMAVTSAERTIAVLVVSVPMHSVGQWRVRCFKL